MNNSSNFESLVPTISAVLDRFPQIRGLHQASFDTPDVAVSDFIWLVRSIAKDGLLVPIQITPEGLLVDGLSRLRALLVLRRNLASEMVVVTERNPWSIANSNIDRRQLRRRPNTIDAVSWQEKKMGVSNQDEQTGTDTSSGLEQAEGNEVDELREPYLLEDLLSASSALTKRILLTLDELAVLRHLSDALCRQAEQEGGDD